MMQLKTIDDLYSTMPWDEIDAVVFDVGNVLLEFDPQHIMETYVPGRPELYPALKQAVFNTPYWVTLDQGLCSLAEAEALMTEHAPELAEAIHAIMTGWAEMRWEIDEGVAAVRACAEHGKKLYVLSNYGNDAFAISESKHDFFRLFNAKVISSRVHMMKPDPKLYTSVTEWFSLEPRRTLFIDDNIGNIAWAIAGGWQGLCYSEKGKIARFFDLKL